MSQISLIGESGKKYSFLIQPITTSFKQIGAVYFIMNRTTDEMNKVIHQKLYVGETDNLAKQFDHPRDPMLSRFEANCICIFPEDDKKKRLKIESDLVGNYNPPGNA